MSRRFDQRTNVFNPNGRINQIEYAIKAIKNSGPALAFHFKDGIILATEKRSTSSLLLAPKHGEKIFRIDSHLLVIVSGLSADANYLVEYLRKRAQDYKYTFNSNIPLQQITEELCDLKQSYTQSGGMRPFGSAFIFVGWDRLQGFQIYTTDPSGNMSSWRAIAQGSNEENSNNLLQENFEEGLAEGISLELCMKVIMGTLDTAQPEVNRVVVAKVILDENEEFGVKIVYLSDDEKKKLVEEVNKKAKK